MSTMTTVQLLLYNRWWLRRSGLDHRCQHHHVGLYSCTRSTRWTRIIPTTTTKTTRRIQSSSSSSSSSSSLLFPGSAVASVRTSSTLAAATIGARMNPKHNHNHNHQRHMMVDSIQFDKKQQQQQQQQHNHYHTSTNSGGSWRLFSTQDDQDSDSNVNANEKRVRSVQSLVSSSTTSPVGSWQPKDWRLAQSVLKELVVKILEEQQQQPKPNLDTRNRWSSSSLLLSLLHRIDFLFQILDRLVEEWEFVQQQQSQQPIKEGDDDDQMPPSSPSPLSRTEIQHLWHQVMQVWWQQLLIWTRNNSTNPSPSPLSRDWMLGKPQQLRDWDTLLGPWCSTKAMLRRLQRYPQSLGLLESLLLSSSSSSSSSSSEEDDESKEDKDSLSSSMLSSSMTLSSPSWYPYLVWLQALSLVTPPEQAPYQARNLVRSLYLQHQRKQQQQQQQQQNETPFRLPLELIATILELWAQSGLPESGPQADAYLQYFLGNDDQNELVTLHPPPPASSSSSSSSSSGVVPQIYCSVMEAHSRSNPNARAALQRIQELWTELQQQRQHQQPLDASIYTRVCQALVDCHPVVGPEATLAAVEILEQLCASSTSTTTIPNNNNNNNNNNNHKNNQGGQPQQQPQPPTLLPQPNRSTFNTVFLGLARLGQAKDIALWLDRMKGLASAEQLNNHAELYPDLVSLATLLWAYARQGDLEQAHEAKRRLFLTLNREQYATTNPLGVSNPLVWQELFLHWWSILGTSSSSSSGRQVVNDLTLFLQEVQELVDQNDKLECGLTTSALNTLLACYAKQGTLDGAQKATQLYRWMESVSTKPSSRSKSSSSSSSSLVPNSESQLLLLSTWCQAGDPQQAEQVLRGFCATTPQTKDDDDDDHHHNKDDDNNNDNDYNNDHHNYNYHHLLEPQHFHVVMNAWIQSQHPQAAQKANALLELMEACHVEPNAATYTTLLSAWARSQTSDPAKPIELLLHRIQKQQQQQQQQQQGNQPLTSRTYYYSKAIAGLSKSTDPQANRRAQQLFDEMDELGIPRTQKIYHSLMMAWSRKNKPDRVEELFQELDSRYQQQQQQEQQQGDFILNRALKPHPSVFATRLHAWSRAGNPEKTFQVLKEWIAAVEQEIAMTRRFPSFLTVAATAANSSSSSSSSSLSSYTNLPETSDFNALLQAWSRSKRPDAAEKAELGLEYMFRMAAAGLYNCQPNLHSFTTVISAYANSGAPHAGQKALELLNRLKNNNTNNNNYSSSLVGDHESGKTGMEATGAAAAAKGASASMKPDFYLYVEVLVALLRSPPDANGENEWHVHELLQELLQRDKSSWRLPPEQQQQQQQHHQQHHQPQRKYGGGRLNSTTTHARRTSRLLLKLREALQSSSFATRDQLMEELQHLEYVAMTATSSLQRDTD